MPKIEISKHPEFRVIHANGIFGGVNPNEGSIAFYTDILEPKMKEEVETTVMTLDHIKREMQVDVRMSIMDFVQMANWMNSHIKRLEEAGILRKGEEHPAKKLDYGV